MLFFFFKQKTAYEMRISDWSSDVCSSDLQEQFAGFKATALLPGWQRPTPAVGRQHGGRRHAVDADNAASDAHLQRRLGPRRAFDEIGRASCRERVCQYV